MGGMAHIHICIWSMPSPYPLPHTTLYLCHPPYPYKTLKSVPRRTPLVFITKRWQRSNPPAGPAAAPAPAAQAPAPPSPAAAAPACPWGCPGSEASPWLRLAPAPCRRPRPRSTATAGGTAQGGRSQPEAAAVFPGSAHWRHHGGCRQCEGACRLRTRDRGRVKEREHHHHHLEPKWLKSIPFRPPGSRARGCAKRPLIYHSMTIDRTIK